MTNTPPSSPGGPQALGLAWSIPVLLAVYIGLGYWLGKLGGAPVVGVLAGWLAGMAAIFYEIWKVLKRGSGSTKGGAS